MDTGNIARTLAELGNETRLEIFRLLVKSGADGMTIGEIGRRLGVPASTLGFHLRGLVTIGLVSQQKDGRSVYCRAELQKLVDVLHVLETECCSEQGTGRIDSDVA